MQLRCFLIGVLFFPVLTGYSQKERVPALTDTTFYDYDELFSELDALLDSLYTPRNFGLVNAGAGTGFFQYNTSNGTTASQQHLVLTPGVAFFHKSGFGAGLTASLLTDGVTSNPWQYSATVSYDYLKKRLLVAGFSLTRYWIKKDLPFYTSPLQNEVNAYFSIRQHWLKPSVSAGYGWGSRTSVAQRTDIIDNIRRRRRNQNGNVGTGTTVTSSKESVADFTMQFSVRHDFYFLHLFSGEGYVRLTPLLSFTAGSQQFGFNLVSNTTIQPVRQKSGNTVSVSRTIVLDDRILFGPQALTTALRTEYASGKWFVQPQFLLDYFFQAQSKKITPTYLLNLGFIL